MIFCCGVRRSTAPPGAGQCHPGLVTRPHAGGTVKHQLGSGLLPGAERTQPRAGGTVKRQLGSGLPTCRCYFLRCFAGVGLFASRTLRRRLGGLSMVPCPSTIALAHSR